MKTHTKIYMDFFNYGIEDFIPCEIPGCGVRANDINHIKCRGMGGDPKGSKDVIENLMAMCRKHHIEYGDVPNKIEWLKEVHLKYIEANSLKR